MHQLVVLSVERFFKECYGEEIWDDILFRAGLDHGNFLSPQGQRRTARRIIVAAARGLDRPAQEILEDIGGWIVRREDVRRLFRYTGSTLVDFLTSLGQLPSRMSFFAPGTTHFSINVRQISRDEFQLYYQGLPVYWGWVLSGCIRGMSDDYGSLTTLEVTRHLITINIASEMHEESRPFTLSIHNCRSQA
ncbi:heme NO-binding domain-containing protein [Paracoccus ravus]|uniref:heme NO-binding domain-containing protein n=1 Tax=Paracoccus ravus TaxID=2447760 RepID=UPI00106DE2BB|nr:heme NO-binding domain-containing protein [Paracoccus ravus]